ncbi:MULTISPECIES: molybdenum ABC transporter ATP-binding protein [Methylomonas]|uniref:Molybdenum ABC transporter ATP-binding protein n=1 Tax=Methylomonas koyamae TaxID=702114 RepID=A0AA91I4U3_9GAMM|nr:MULTISPECIES: molybdenum ABC transporter ATP-binding protein [Methylomonas]ANE57959.1 molybdenum ABC transporter ATP-binding protein [Methylomonas sp. DH-1]OAI25143.1 molybdenum ABC transporter ATP-binding protein [Methylomonas koyamae]
MDDITARFKINWPSFALNVDITIPGRGVTALFGHSGSGKTTLLRCIAGLERAPQGFLSVNGEVWQDDNHWMPTHKRPLGYVFQEASLFSHLTVMGNLRYGLKRISDAQQVSLTQSIDLLGISHLLDRKPDSLSGGERQRVGIARALAVSPRILLMDEPLAALDLKRKQEILPYLEQLHDELNIPVLYVSHSPDEVARLADHLVVLDDGYVLANGSLAETLARLDLPIRLGEDVGVVIDATIGAIDEQWHLARVDFSGGSLWTRDRGLPIGRRVRVRVLARDVSLAEEHPGHSSIQNVLRGRIDAIANDEHPGLALVRVQVGDSTLVARLTKRAAAELNVALGQELWVQVKSVALME